MNYNKLKNLVRASGAGINPHSTIESNKKQVDSRQIMPTQRESLQSISAPQMSVPQSKPTQMRFPQSVPTPQRQVIQSVPIPQRSVSQNVPTPQRQATQSVPTPQKSVPQNVVDKYVPVNDAPILKLGADFQKVAQGTPQQVAQAVAQGSWVAQDTPQQVAQSVVQVVAHILTDKDVQIFKEEIFKIQTIEAKKKYVISIGFGISNEKRGKKYYLYGIKKIDGKKRRLYIGNSTKL